MVAVPPVILVFDISALSVASPAEWREFSRVGSCYVPQVVYEEMRLLFDRSPDPDLERIAKSFNRFYASSGWQITDVTAHHASFKVGSGQALTRRSRVSLAVGRCAFALSESFPNSLVVLVSKDRSLLQRLYEIPAVNLCGITGESLLQWSRTGQRPIAVSQKFQQFRTAYGLPPNTTGVSQSYQKMSPTRMTAQPAKPTFIRSSALPDWVPDLISLLLAAAGLAIAAYLIWFLLNSQELKKNLPRTFAPTEFPLAVDKISFTA
ncbi:MAG TPA: PIN domain-containing protein [Coleofasciculaceae cyanobacterium]